MAAKRPVFAFVIVLAIASVGLSALSASGGGKKWKKILDGAKISLVEAIQKAEQETGGRAIEAEIEMVGGKVIMEVVVVKGKTNPQLLEVEVNGETGDIIKIEEEDDDDDDDDDDD
ncbi:MAG: PepSY domain-containing protein [Planctomycetota bacterium]|nr:PepSY domain-containing protein [Planctomycetota bacterium]